MNLLAEQIKSSVNMLDVYNEYGIKVNQKGFIRCPFHSEKTASLGLYDCNKKWKCFGCGAGGSVIDFVMQYFGLDFTQAILRIASDFCILGICKSKRTVSEAERKRAKQKLELRKFQNEYDKKSKEHLYCFTLVQNAPELSPNEIFADEIAQEIAYSISRLDFLDYWLDENPWRRSNE